MAITIGNVTLENAGFDPLDENMIVKVTAIDSNGLHRDLVYTGDAIPEGIIRDLNEESEADPEDNNEHVEG